MVFRWYQSSISRTSVEDCLHPSGGSSFYAIDHVAETKQGQTPPPLSCPIINHHYTLTTLSVLHLYFPFLLQRANNENQSKDQKRPIRQRRRKEEKKKRRKREERKKRN
jgi:hypothetical protein